MNQDAYKKLYGWVRLTSITAFTQLIIQVVGLLGGVLVIRHLSIQEYAFYTIANTMLGAMNILSNGGIVAGVMAEGGQVYKDKYKLGEVIKTGLSLRILFSSGSILIAGSILLYLLSRNNLNLWMGFIILLSLLPAYFANLSDSMLEVAPKLNQDIIPLQKNQLGTSLGRLGLLLMSVFFFPFTFVVLLADGIPRIIANIQLRKISNKFVVLSDKPNVKIRKSILRIVRRVLPGDIYNIFSVQITIWILSLTGSTSSIAQVGALFRLAAIVNVFTVLFNTLIVPRYSRLPLDRNLQLNRMIKIQLLLMLASCFVVTLVWCFSAQITWLLGDKYFGLEREMVLVIIIFCLNFSANILYATCVSRGWAINPIASILVNISAIIIGVFIFDIKHLEGILIYNIFVSLIMLLLHAIYSFLRASKNYG